MPISFAKPAALCSGGVVGVIAPSSPVRREYMDQGLAALERLGFRCRLGPNVYQRGRYTAGTPAERAADLLALWTDPEVGAVFCARGGYGSMQMLEHLPFEKMRERPIPFLGSSDASSILCALAAKSSAVSFHGPMVAQQLARGFFDSDGMCALLCDSGPLGFQDAPSVTPLHPGAAEGHLLGGCLSIVTALCGTEFLPSFSGAILFLEDTGTKPYQIDRMLTQLQLSGALDGVRGLVFGEMPKCDQHPEQGYRLEDMLRDWTAWMKVPVLFGFPSGHTLSPARTLPFGIRARVDKEGLHLLEGAVL